MLNNTNEKMPHRRARDIAADQPDTANDGGLSESDMKKIAAYINENVGIQLPESKRTLVEGRLRRRMRKLGFSSFRTYIDYVFDTRDGADEGLHLIDALTTNKTDFFREPEHFDYLTSIALMNVEKKRMADGRDNLKIWSAGCSSGEEPYTLSIVLSEVAAKMKGIRFEILATDISQTCLQKAHRGIYTEQQIEPISLELRKKYLLRSRRKDDELVQMGPELRSLVKFQSLNLMSDNFNLPHKMDVIFCRNVMIYFNNEIREKLVAKFERQLHDGGYLFVGHSESLNGIETRLQQVAPMVYRKFDSPEGGVR